MSVHPLVSRNPHAACDSGSPCDLCKRKYTSTGHAIPRLRDAFKVYTRDDREQEARDRHPADKALPVVLDYDVDRTDNVIRLHVPGPWIELDESMLAELTGALINPPKCDRDDCYEAGDFGGLCGPHRDAADALPSGGWRR